MKLVRRRETWNDLLIQCNIEQHREEQRFKGNGNQERVFHRKHPAGGEMGVGQGEGKDMGMWWKAEHTEGECGVGMRQHLARQDLIQMD